MISSPSPNLTSDSYRLAGNQSFEKKDYDTALLMYTLAIENHRVENEDKEGKQDEVRGPRDGTRKEKRSDDKTP